MVEPYDFGPVVPDGCCETSSSDVTDGFAPDFAPIRINFTILAHDGAPLCKCKYRKFTVNLHMDDSWSFTYTNGDPLSSEDQQTYCREIAGAQSILESNERWRKNGKGLGLWDPQKYYGPSSDDNPSKTGTVYFPANRSNNTYGPGGCSIRTPVNDI